jgi:hypothetical protein
MEEMDDCCQQATMSTNEQYLSAVDLLPPSDSIRGAEKRIVVNPASGVRWHQRINDRFIEFLTESPNYQQNFVMTDHRGRITTILMQHEIQILEEWSASGTGGCVKLYRVHPAKKDYRVALVGTFTKNSALLPDLQKQFHDYLMKLHHRLSRQSKTTSISYCYGRGRWTVPAICSYKPTDPTCREYVNGLKERSAQFSPLQAAEREYRNGSAALKKPMVAIDFSNESTGDRLADCSKPQSCSKELLDWQKCLSRRPSSIGQFMSEYDSLKELQEECGNNAELWALRLFWEDVFTTKCPASESTKVPCAQCRSCDIRCAQTIIVVFAAQGVADENILPHLGGMFRLPRYRNFGCKEWSMVGTEEVAQLLTPCSCHGLKACYLRTWFQYVVDAGAAPLSVEQCLCMYGMQKKSACLFLSAFLGIPVGVPVDRHLKVAFLNLEWVHPECSDPTIMSEMIELWLPMGETANMNNVLAGLRQLYQKKQHRQILLDAAERKGPLHQELLTKLTKDIKLPKGGL